MIDGGILLMVLGAIGMGLVPIEQALAYRRWRQEQLNAHTCPLGLH